MAKQTMKASMPKHRFRNRLDGKMRRYRTTMDVLVRALSITYANSAM